MIPTTFGTAEQRRVAVYQKGDILVSTMRVVDSQQPFETAVEHPEYNGGDIIIVEMYQTREDAAAGHKRWLKTMTSGNLPNEIVDKSTSSIALLCDADGDWRIYKRTIEGTFAPPRLLEASND